jgi:staphylococcal nuclease domain-containing protein 1
VYLAFISAPRVGNQNKSEEPFAFAARELIREDLIGRKVDFVIQYILNNRKYISICLDETHVTYNWMLVQRGLAKPINTRSTSKLYEEIKWIADDAMERDANVWCQDADYVEKNLRKVCYPGDVEYSS